MLSIYTLIDLGIWMMVLKLCHWNQDNKGIHYSFELPKTLSKLLFYSSLIYIYWCAHHNLLHHWQLLRYMLLLSTQNYSNMHFIGCLNSCFFLLPRNLPLHKATIYLLGFLVVEMLAISRLSLLQVTNIFWSVSGQFFPLSLNKHLGMNWIA